MSPEPAAVIGTATVATFRPAPLATPAGGSSRAREADSRARAAGYAAGWAAGARAAAEAGSRQQRLAAEQAEQDRVERDRRLTEALVVLERATAAASALVLPVLDDAVRSVQEAALELATAVV